MARRVKDQKIDSRTSRLKLKVRSKPYFCRIGPDTHLGYRRLRDRDGSWTVRRYVKDRPSNPYDFEVIGHADDLNDANGGTVLTFDQAVDVARQRMHAPFAKKKVVTVADAVELYLEDLERGGRGVDSLVDARGKLERFVLSAPVVPDDDEPDLKVPFGTVPLEDLTTELISNWLLDLATSAPRTRSGTVRNGWEGTEDQKRARRANAARVWNTFRAVLYCAFRKSKVSSSVAWERVEALRDIDKARDRALTVVELQRLTNGADPEFRPMLKAGMLTGSRYSSLADLRVKDFNPDAGTLTLAHRKGSKGTKTYYCHLNAESHAFFAGLCAGRKSDELILRRDDGSAWNKSNQQRPMAEACKRAGLDPPVTFYALRHSWISLAVMGGMSFADVAANCGTSVKMIEKHYSHLDKKHRAKQVEQFAPTFGIDPGNLQSIRG